MNTTISVICYKSKTLANGKHPLMLRIIQNRKTQYKSLNISVAAKHWDFDKNAPKPKCPHKDLINKIILKTKLEYQQKVLEKKANEEEFTASSLIHEQKDEIKAMTVDDFYKQLINELKEKGQIGNSYAYLSSYDNLKNFMNLGEFAEEATIIVDEVSRTDKSLHFIEANTQEVDFNHLANECITPVFAKDNELTINHAQFIDVITEATQDFFKGETVDSPNIRVSHVIKGRTPEAIHKKANELLESEKNIYYERCAFSIDVPTIYETVEGNKLNLSIVGVRAYNQMNLYSKKSPELFRLAIGFKNQVCCNMYIFTDGYKDDLRVSNVSELYKGALKLFNNFNPAKQIHLLQTLGNTTMSEHQFCQILGRMRLYQCLPTGMQKRLPRMLLTDTQINSVAKSYINNENFGGTGGELNMWKFYNLLTGANKSSYIDSFLDRSLNATEMATGINMALHGDEKYKWFID